MVGYVRRVGKRVCITLDDSRFCFKDYEDLTEEEKQVVDQGGGDVEGGDRYDFICE